MLGKWASRKTNACKEQEHPIIDIARNIPRDERAASPLAERFAQLTELLNIVCGQWSTSAHKAYADS